MTHGPGVRQGRDVFCYERFWVLDLFDWKNGLLSVKNTHMNSRFGRIVLPALAIYLLVGILILGCKSSDSSSDIQSPSVEPIPAPESPLIALTPTEYNNTIRDLLGMPSNPKAWPDPPAVAAQVSPVQGEQSGLFGSAPITPDPWPWNFPAEAGVEDFEGMADGQESSPYSVEELNKAATHFGSYAMVSPIFFACEKWDSLEQEEQKSCGWESVERFAQRAWRRPLSEEERSELASFWEEQWGAGTPEEAVVLTLAGILQAPAFVFRIEEGDVENAQGDAIPLTDWEMASRLSYFLWDSMPDPVLFGAAAKGELSTPEQVEEQARRMLEDPRARDAVVHFHDQLLGTTRVHGISPARREYGPLYGIAPEPPLDTTGDEDWPSILLPIRHSMALETQLFVERSIFDGAGTLEALLTDNTGYMSDRTAPIYGDGVTVLEGDSIKQNYGFVAAVGQTGSVTVYPVAYPESERAGVLTLPSVLALGAYAVHPAPIIRGKRILERFACQTFPPPPPGAEAALPPDTAEVESTNRERTEAATADAVCAGCHDVLNPPGFAFENYDALGRWRDEDNGIAVDASGVMNLVGGESFSFVNGVELAHQLSTSNQVRDCYALHWARYATGVHLAGSDQGVTALRSHFQEDDRIQELLVSIAKSDLFRYLRGGEAP